MKNLLLPFSLLLLFIVIFAGSIFFQFSKNPKIPIPQGLAPSVTPVPTKATADFSDPAKMSLQKLSLTTNDSGFDGASISGDQKFLYLANPWENFIYLVDVALGKISDKIPILNPLATIPINQSLLVIQKNGLTILSSNHEIIKSIFLGFEPTASLITSDLKYLLLTDSQNNTLNIYSAKTLELVSLVPLEAKPTDLFENNNLVFISFSNDSRLAILSLSSLKIVSTLNLQFNPHTFGFKKDSSEFLVTDANGLSLWIFNSVKDKTPKRIKLNDAPFDLSKIPQTDFYLILGKHGSVFLFDAKEQRIIKTFTIQSSLLSKDTWGKVLFVSSPTPKVFLLSTNGKKLQAFTLSSSP